MANSLAAFFVVHCRGCGKVQAAAAARDLSEATIQQALHSLVKAERHNATYAKRLAFGDLIPDITAWCSCGMAPMMDD